MEKVIIPIDLESILAISNCDADLANQLISDELEKYSQEHGIPMDMIDWKPVPAKET